MEKRAAKTLGSKPNQRNGSVHRHGHKSSSVRAGGAHGSVPRNNFSLEQQDDHHAERFSRPPSLNGRSSQTQTQETWEASSSFSSPKLKKNTTMIMRRPKTHPELLNRDEWRHTGFMNNPVDQTVSTTKLLVNVTVSHSTGPLRALLSKDATVEDVIKVALVLYAKEGRKPLLSNDPTSFGLHYSQFSINRLNPADNVKDLGSRRFFLCSKATVDESCRLSFRSGETGVTAIPSSSSSPSPFSFGREIQKIARIMVSWFKKIMSCLLL